jgi:predicted flap endonuclease-1-like 5' DNA nuclease
MAKADYEKQLSALKADNAALQEKATALEAKTKELQGPAASLAGVTTAAALPQDVDQKKPEEIKANLVNQLPLTNNDSASSQEKVTVFQGDKPAEQDAAASVAAAVPVTPDDLMVIKGIGPVITKRLNNAGIYTFRQLAAITPDRLRQICGELIQRLANEDDILNQAKKLAGEQDQAANLSEQEAVTSTAVSMPVTPDDLIVIKGIGPMISRKLNNAGIYTFQELAALTPDRLRQICGDLLQRLANEDDILNQAKKMAAEKDRAANS